VKKNKFDSAIALRAQYGYGDNVQKGQLWDILKGRAEVRVGEGEDLRAETKIDNGKRVIYMSGYQSDMSEADLMRLAVVLGHEAYRDGYKTGEIDAHGNLVTAEKSSYELKEASIARIAMGDRINQEHEWFYDVNGDFAFESFFLSEAKFSGDYSLFDDYLSIVYDNNEDYFWQWASTNGNYQNEGRYRETPLLNSGKKADEINDRRLQAAFERYIAVIPENERDIQELYENFNSDRELQHVFGYVPVNYESLYMFGCMLMSTKYGVEAITGNFIDTLFFNKFVADRVANPWNGDSFSGKQSYSMNEIARWDIFRVTPRSTSTFTPYVPTNDLQRRLEDYYMNFRR